MKALKTILGAYSLCLSVSYAATSVTQNGTTWTFDTDYTTGVFVNGDPWVKENSLGTGVTISSMTPTPDASGSSRIKHGTMINPTAGYGVSQGWDNDAQLYSESLNVGNDLPTTFSSNTSLLSAVSITADDQRPQLDQINILTILPANVTPDANDFRPPYCGTDKTLTWNKSDIDYSVLSSLAQPNNGTNVPALATVESYMARSWIEVQHTSAQQYSLPLQNQPNYGREMAHQLNKVMLSLQLDYTNAQKEILAIQICQYAIDIYGAAKNGGLWRAAGGFNHTRKAPLLVGAKLLGDLNMIAYTDATVHNLFGEDRSTFYVTQSDVDRGHAAHSGNIWTEAEDHNPATDGDARRRTAYTVSDIGMAEWGEQHDNQPERDGANWDVSYRDVVGVGLVGSVLVTEIMGLRSQWNHEALFDYVIGRFWPIEESRRSNQANYIQLFEADMWDAYSSYEKSGRSRTSQSSGLLLGF
jgi:hypothetical protein